MRMRKILRGIGIGLGVIVALLVLAVIGLLAYGQSTFKRTHADRPVYEIIADTSPEGVARGEYLVRDVIRCQVCHAPPAAEGEEQDRDAPLIGQVEDINFGPISGKFATPNLTPDKETGLGDWTDGQIARAIREGLDKDNVELVVMPSYVFHHLSDADTAAMVGYLRSLEPVRNDIPPFEMNAFGKAALALRLFGPPALTRPVRAGQTTPPLGTAEYGEYLVTIIDCAFCHGENLAGGPVPFAEAGTPPSANLTPAGELVGWTEADFIRAMTEGKTPTGRELHEAMPRFKNIKDEDLSAIFKYLQSLPPAESR
jgi:mono/diheme cytochrome c family protein